MKKVFLLAAALLLAGAGCATGPQETIKSPQLGKDDVPVEVVEYFDFQCPACKTASANAVPFIISDYVNTGKVKLVFKNLAFIGPESRLAAVAGLCAEEQGKFYDYYEKIFEAQGAENSGIFTKDKLKSLAKDAELDTARFGSCLDAEKYRSQVAAETSEAKIKNITATPSFLINDKKISGGSFLSIKNAIEKELEK